MNTQTNVSVTPEGLCTFQVNSSKYTLCFSNVHSMYVVERTLFKGTHLYVNGGDIIYMPPLTANQVCNEYHQYRLKNPLPLE